MAGTEAGLGGAAADRVAPAADAVLDGVGGESAVIDGQATGAASGTGREA
jgi:hypothetical protein